MATSETEICNMAIMHIGSSKAIASLDERSNESNVCGMFYDIARDTILRSFAWPFATKRVTLGLVEEDPNDEWAFSYRYPSDCKFLRRIPSGTRNDDSDTQVPHVIYGDDDGQILLCDVEDADLVYTFLVEDVSKYPHDFVMALSYQLAALIAPTLAGATKRRELVKDMFDLSNYWLGLARQAAAGEEVEDVPPEAESIRAREGSTFHTSFPTVIR